MKFEFTEIKTFDVEKERNRINQCFEGEIRLKLLKILDLFCEEKFQECFYLINKLGYSKKDGCSEIEFLSTFIYDSLWEIENLGVKVKKIE